jgi:hypothetical protein
VDYNLFYEVYNFLKCATPTTRGTSEFTIFINDLFDSLNGSSSGKDLRGVVTRDLDQGPGNFAEHTFFEEWAAFSSTFFKKYDYNYQKGSGFG